jgi:hypothetical protein
MYAHFKILSFTSLLTKHQQLFGVNLQADGADMDLHANAKGVCSSGAERIVVKLMHRPGYNSIMCKIVMSGRVCPQRKSQSGSAAEEVSLPELLLPLSATQDAGQDTSEVITGALKVHSINPDAKMMARATTLHVRLLMLTARKSIMLQ